MYTPFTLYIENDPVDSYITGLVSEIHKHGREWNLKKVCDGLIEI